VKSAILESLDGFLHWALDGYINKQLPGWGQLQLWQNHVCNAYERNLDG
jgi:hypothetical protein